MPVIPVRAWKSFWLLALVVLLLSGNTAWAAPSALTYQGRILKSDGTPLTYGAVSFIFQITDPAGTCLIYQEQVTGYNMTNSGGIFDVPIGSGSVQYPLSGTFTVLDSFNNASSFSCGTCALSGGTYTCSNATGTYAAASGDGRKLRVAFYDGSGWNTISPDSVIRSVPFAGYSLSAEKLGTNTASDFLLKAGLPTCSTGTFLSWDGTNLTCAGVSGTSGGTVTNVSSGNSYITITSPTSTPQLTLNVGTAANTVAAGNDARIVNSIQSGASASGDLGGTYPGPSVVAIRGVGVTTAMPTSGQVFKFNGTNWAPATLGTSDISGLNADLSSYLTETNFFTYMGTANCSASQTMYWNSVTNGFQCVAINVSLAGDVTGAIGTSKVVALQNQPVDSTAPTSNQVLQWNGSKWAAATLPAGNAGTVTSVTGSAPISVATGTSTPVISISQASSSTNGYLSSADWTAFNGKQAAGNYVTALTGDVTASGPGSASATLAKLQGSTLTITTPASGQYVRYNGSAFVNSALQATDLSGTLSASSIPSLDWSKITTGKPTTLSGYGITDSLVKNGGGVATITAGLDASKPSSPVAGDLFVASDSQKIYRYNGSSWDLLSSGSGTGGTITGITAGTGLTGGGTSGAVTLNVNAGTSANQIVQLDSSAKLPAVDGSAVTNLNPANLSAVIPISKGGTGQGTATLGFNALSPVTTKGDLITSDGTNNIRLATGSNGQVLSADSTQTGGLKWVTLSSGTVTSVSGSSPITVSNGTTTPSISLANGTGAGQVHRWDGANWTATKLTYTDLINASSGSPWPIASCTSGQAVTWSSASDSFTCTTISVATSQLTGTLASAQMPAFTGGDVTSSAGSLALTLAGSGVTAGTYKTVTVDAKGRVTAGTNPTTLSGFGITDAVQNLGGSPGIQTGFDASKPASPSAGTIYFATDSKIIYQYNSSAWVAIASSSGSGGTLTALTGDVSASGSGSVAATVNSVGTSSAANIHSAEVAANAATNANTASTIVKRDTSGNFSAGAITHSASSGDVYTAGSGTNTVAVQGPSGAIGTSYVLRLPTSVASVAGQVLTSDTSGNLSWTTPAASSLADGKIWVGQSGTPTAVTPSGDVTMTNAGAYTVTKLQGTAVSATAPSSSGQILRYNGTSWTPNFLSMFDLRSTITGSQAFGGVGCTSGQTLTWTAATDNLACTNIAISGTQVTYASQTAKTFFAAPPGASGAPTFRTIASTDLPSGTLSGAGTTGCVPYYSASSTLANSAIYNDTSTGNTGVGTTTPQSTFQVGDGSIAPYYTSGITSQHIYNPGFSAVANSAYAVSAGFVIGDETNGVLTGQIYTWADKELAILNGATGGHIEFYTNGGPVMNISNSGNIGIGTTSPAVSIDMGQRNDAIALPAGSTAQRPTTPAEGMIRYNNTTKSVEAYQGSTTSWGGMATTVAKADLTAQSAAIASTTIYTPTADGIYQVCGYANITTAATSGNLTVNMGYQSESGANSAALFYFSAAGLGNWNSYCYMVYAKANYPITYSTSLSGTAGSLKYTLHMRIVQMP